MTTDTTSPLEDPTFVTALLDTLIPPSEDGNLPGAGSLGVGDGVASAIAANARVAPAVAAALQALLDQTPGFATLDLDARVEALKTIEAAHPALIPSLTTPLYFAYYQHPTVLIGLGLPARPPYPGGYETDPTDPDLLDLLRSRAKS